MDSNPRHAALKASMLTTAQPKLSVSLHTPCVCVHARENTYVFIRPVVCTCACVRARWRFLICLHVLLPFRFLVFEKKAV